MPETIRLPVTGGVQLELDVWSRAPGVPFLLVHGLASNRHLWDGVAQRLAADGHAVATVDQRGHGGSDKPDDGYDFATVAADLAAVVDGLGWDRPVVAGQSWGANVAVELAARHPEATRGIACVDGGWIELGARFPSWEECATVMAPPRIAGTPLADLERRLTQLHADWPPEGIAGALACYECLPDGTVAPWLTFERHMTILRSLWEHRPSERWHDLVVPVLLVPCETGDERWDGAKQEAVSRAAEALRAVRTHWFRAHHDVHAQHPDAVARLFRSCVEEGFFA